MKKILDSDWMRTVQFKYNTSAIYTLKFWIMIGRKTIGNFLSQWKNTSKNTSFWLSVWKTWYEGKSIALEIEEHEPAELNRLLEKF